MPPISNGKLKQRRGVAVLKEFLYVDVTRVRSLLGQLDDGVVEGVIQSRNQTHGGQLGLRAALLQAQLMGSRTESAEESKSTQDILFTIFEESADSEGIIRTIDPVELAIETDWDSSAIHGRFVEGEIVRLTNPISLIDPGFFRSRIERFVSMYKRIRESEDKKKEQALAVVKSAAEASIDEELSNVPRDKRTHARKLAMAKFNKEVSEAASQLGSQFEDMEAVVVPMLEVLGDFLPPDAISVRFPACGQSRPELALSGSLLERSEYIQLERDALFSRYGSILKGWTSVVQIASIPSESEGSSALKPDFAQFSEPGGSKINRPALEQNLVALLGTLEATGVAEGPLWPGISVIPLGIYRVVPRTLGEFEITRT
jgi:hypothetical protein